MEFIYEIKLYIIEWFDIYIWIMYCRKNSINYSYRIATNATIFWIDFIHEVCNYVYVTRKERRPTWFTQLCICITPSNYYEKCVHFHTHFIRVFFHVHQLLLFIPFSSLQMGKCALSTCIDNIRFEMGAAWQRASGKRSGMHHCGESSVVTRYSRWDHYIHS